MNKKLIKGYILVILSAVIFGTMPLMAKHIYASGVNSLTLVFLRNILSLPVMALLAKLGGKSLKINKKALPPISLIALMGSCVTPILLFSSYNFIPSGTATVFHFIYPAVVFMAEFVFLKKKIKSASALSIVLCIVGICMFYAPGQKLGVTGSALALLSGVTYAIYIVLLSEFKYKEITGFVFGFYLSAVCSIVMLLILLLSGKLMLPATLSGWILSFVFAIAVNVGAVILFQKGTFLTGGTIASVLSTFEPITSVLVGIAFLGESAGASTIIGTILVIFAGILITLSDMKKVNKKI